MRPKSLLLRGEQMARFGRRDMLAGLAAAALLWPTNSVGAAEAVSIGLNPLFLDSDIQLLSLIQSYLAERLGRPVQLIKRRTYQEITALLLSGQLDAAWVCDDPYVTYVIATEGSKAQSFDDIRGTVHAFSDPDSTSGFLVTRSLLALRHTTPAQFFRTFFFTYGHRNVVRAVATGLAESGSIDGYVCDVMREREPELINKTRVVYTSEKLGFPPIVGLKSAQETTTAKAISEAFLEMPTDPVGRQILSILELDGFTKADPDLYQGTLEEWLLVKAQA